MAHHKKQMTGINFSTGGADINMVNGHRKIFRKAYNINRAMQRNRLLDVDLNKEIARLDRRKKDTNYRFRSKARELIHNSGWRGVVAQVVFQVITQEYKAKREKSDISVISSVSKETILPVKHPLGIQTPADARAIQRQYAVKTATLKHALKDMTYAQADVKRMAKERTMNELLDVVLEAKYDKVTEGQACLVEDNSKVQSLLMELFRKSWPTGTESNEQTLKGEDLLYALNFLKNTRIQPEEIKHKLNRNSESTISYKESTEDLILTNALPTIQKKRCMKTLAEDSAMQRYVRRYRHRFNPQNLIKYDVWAKRSIPEVRERMETIWRKAPHTAVRLKRPNTAVKIEGPPSVVRFCTAEQRGAELERRIQSCTERRLQQIEQKRRELHAINEHKKDKSGAVARRREDSMLEKRRILEEKIAMQNQQTNDEIGPLPGSVASTKGDIFSGTKSPQAITSKGNATPERLKVRGKIIIDSDGDTMKEDSVRQKSQCEPTPSKSVGANITDKGKEHRQPTTSSADVKRSAKGVRPSASKPQQKTKDKTSPTSSESLSETAENLAETTSHVLQPPSADVTHKTRKRISSPKSEAKRQKQHQQKLLKKKPVRVAPRGGDKYAKMPHDWYLPDRYHCGKKIGAMLLKKDLASEQDVNSGLQNDQRSDGDGADDADIGSKSPFPSQPSGVEIHIQIEEHLSEQQITERILSLLSEKHTPHLQVPGQELSSIKEPTGPPLASKSKLLAELAVEIKEFDNVLRESRTTLKGIPLTMLINPKIIERASTLGVSPNGTPAQEVIDVIKKMQIQEDERERKVRLMRIMMRNTRKVGAGWNKVKRNFLSEKLDLDKFQHLETDDLEYIHQILHLRDLFGKRMRALEASERRPTATSQFQRRAFLFINKIVRMLNKRLDRLPSDAVIDINKDVLISKYLKLPTRAISYLERQSNELSQSAADDPATVANVLKYATATAMFVPIGLEHVEKFIREHPVTERRTQLHAQIGEYILDMLGYYSRMEKSIDRSKQDRMKFAGSVLPKSVTNMFEFGEEYIKFSTDDDNEFTMDEDESVFLYQLGRFNK